MISDKHGMFDDRIYAKEAIGLKNAGYEVCHLCVGENNVDFVSEDGIRIIRIKDIKYSNIRILNKLIKIFITKNLYKSVFKTAYSLNYDVYHIHDHQLIKTAVNLKKLLNAKIIYDIHDPFYQNIIDYNKGNLLKETYFKLKSKTLINAEKNNINKFDIIITTEENLAARYKNLYGINSEIIYNYTDLKYEPTKDVDKKEYDAIYSGLISKNRSIFHIGEAVKTAKNRINNIKVAVLGSFACRNEEKDFVKFINENNLSENIILLGNVPYTEVVKYYNKSKIGLCIFQPIPTHFIILQIKLFEYSAMGLPIIGSNFGHIKNYIEADKTGILVNPLNPTETADSLVRLLSDSLEYNYYKNNALNSSSKYRWEFMEKKLLAIYKQFDDK